MVLSSEMRSVSGLSQYCKTFAGLVDPNPA